jgi:hypothetical protein
MPGAGRSSREIGCAETGEMLKFFCSYFSWSYIIKKASQRLTGRLWNKNKAGLPESGLAG